MNAPNLCLTFVLNMAAHPRSKYCQQLPLQKFEIPLHYGGWPRFQSSAKPSPSWPARLVETRFWFGGATQLNCLKTNLTKLRLFLIPRPAPRLQLRRARSRARRRSPSPPTLARPRMQQSLCQSPSPTATGSPTDFGKAAQAAKLMSKGAWTRKKNSEQYLKF